jgi:hypothetical protein
MRISRVASCARQPRLVLEEEGPQVLSKRVIVPASVSECFAVASRLDAYMDWCSGSGLEEVQILEWDKDGRARKIVMVAGKFGLQTANTLIYSYSSEEDEVAFECIQGDVMPTLNGRYVFRDASEEAGSSPLTEVTYELKIGFAMGIPGWTHKALVGVILGTALGSFKSHIVRRG